MPESDRPIVVAARLHPSTVAALDAARGPGDSRSDVLRRVVESRIGSVTADADESKRIARAHLESPDVRAFRAEHPDAPVSGRGGIFERDEWSDMVLTAIHPDRDVAWRALVAAGREMVRAEEDAE